MKLFTRMFGVVLVSSALIGLVACSDDTTETTTDNGTTDVVEGTDNTVVTDTTVEEDVANEDTTVAEDTTVVDTTVVDTTVADTTVEDTNVEEDVPCVPNCVDRECGDDGCDGSCGDCGANQVCDDMYGTCVDSCIFPDGLPTEWGPTGVVNDGLIPANATLAGESCHDFTGDGTGNSGLTGLAGQINGSIQDALTGGEIGILFEFAGVTDFDNTAAFTFQGLIGEPTTAGTVGGDYMIEPMSYNQDTCMPLIRFEDSSITEGVLNAGPGNLRIAVNLKDDFGVEDMDIDINLNLIDAGVTGTIGEGDADGVILNDAVLYGVLTKAELEQILADLQGWCDDLPEGETNDICSYLSVATTAMALLFDLHQMEDGSYVLKSKDYEGNAASLCLTHTAIKAKVTGLKAE